MAFWVLTYLFLGYLKSARAENGTLAGIPAPPPMIKSPSASISEAHSPNLSHQDSPVLKPQPVLTSQSLPMSPEHRIPLTQSSPAVIPIIIESADSDILKKEDFSFLNLDESPWIIVPKSTHIILSVQESPEAAAFLDLFDATSEQLFAESDTRESLSEVIPGWLYEWMLQVIFPFTADGCSSQRFDDRKKCQRGVKPLRLVSRWTHTLILNGLLFQERITA